MQKIKHDKHDKRNIKRKIGWSKAARGDNKEENTKKC